MSSHSYNIVIMVAGLFVLTVTFISGDGGLVAVCTAKQCPS